MSAAVLAEPGDLPLLDRDVSVGVLYTEVDSGVQPAVDLAWQQLVAAGMDSYAFTISWSDLTDDFGTPDPVAIANLSSTIAQLNQFGLQIYFGLATIDTNNLQIPAIFLDPNDARELAPGLSFDSPEVVGSYLNLIDVLMPMLVQNGAFYFSVGNEVDIWLAPRPDEIAGYTAFAQAARERIHAWEPEMAVGPTMTSEARDKPWIYQPLVAVSDAVSFTYYPLFGGIVLDPLLAKHEFDALVSMADGKDILMQEVGCPSGPLFAKSTIFTSYEIQRRWTAAMFQQIRNRPQFRFASYLHVADWPSEVVAALVAYYDLDVPEFVEYLSTLGAVRSDGLPKPAYYELLHQISLTARGRRPERIAR